MFVVAGDAFGYGGLTCYIELGVIGGAVLLACSVTLYCKFNLHLYHDNHWWDLKNALQAVERKLCFLPTRKLLGLCSLPTLTLDWHTPVTKLFDATVESMKDDRLTLLLMSLFQALLVAAMALLECSARLGLWAILDLTVVAVYLLGSIFHDAWKLCCPRIAPRNLCLPLDVIIRLVMLGVCCPFVFLARRLKVITRAAATIVKFFGKVCFKDVDYGRRVKLSILFCTLASILLCISLIYDGQHVWLPDYGKSLIENLARYYDVVIDKDWTGLNAAETTWNTVARVSFCLDAVVAVLLGLCVGLEATGGFGAADRIAIAAFVLGILSDAIPCFVNFSATLNIEEQIRQMNCSTEMNHMWGTIISGAFGQASQITVALKLGSVILSTTVAVLRAAHLVVMSGDRDNVTVVQAYHIRKAAVTIFRFAPLLSMCVTLPVFAGVAAYMSAGESLGCGINTLASVGISLRLTRTVHPIHRRRPEDADDLLPDPAVGVCAAVRWRHPPRRALRPHRVGVLHGHAHGTCTAQHGGGGQRPGSISTFP